MKMIAATLMLLTISTSAALAQRNGHNDNRYNDRHHNDRHDDRYDDRYDNRHHNHNHNNHKYQIERHAKALTNAMAHDLRLSRRQIDNIYRIAKRKARYQFDRDGLTRREHREIISDIHRVLDSRQEHMFYRVRHRYGL